jgi:hypothetical protein
MLSLLNYPKYPFFLLAWFFEINMCDIVPFIGNNAKNNAGGAMTALVCSYAMTPYEPFINKILTQTCCAAFVVH